MKILVSACLLGIQCKYSGKSNQSESLWGKLQGHEVLLICPEQLGGLSTPRNPAEILFTKDGIRVQTETGEDVTNSFLRGAEIAFQLAEEEGITLAVLKDGSPSCGVNSIYDGTFSKCKIEGCGVFAKRLMEKGILCYDENTMEMGKENVL